MNHDFFEIISRVEFENLLSNFQSTSTQNVPLAEGYGFVLAEQIVSPENLPLCSRSCMDGYAVNARDAFGATEANPAYLELKGTLRVNDKPDFEIESGECAAIATGGTLPDGADAVVMVEHTHDMGSGTIEIRKAAVPNDHIMLAGEDAKEGEILFKKGHKLRFQDIGLLAALGISEVKIYSQPKVAIISTGDELTEISAKQRIGSVRDVNSHTLRCILKDAGAHPVNYGIVPDNLNQLKDTLKQALNENDLVLLSGGSSIGMRDLTVQAIEEIKNSKILAHGVAISPGKPTILATCGGKPVLGLPGQVTSVQVVMVVLVMNFIRHLMGESNPFDPQDIPMIEAELARNTPTKQGREDYVRVTLEHRENDLPLAKPIYGKSGLLKTMIKADGLLKIPSELEGAYAGEKVKIRLI